MRALKIFSTAVSSGTLLLATGCGGGSGDSGSGTGMTTTSASTTLSGVASKGPLKSALVTVYPVNGAGVVGQNEIAHATTGSGTSAGAYTLDLGGYSGNIQIVVTAPAGATTADEATGQDVPLPASFVLHANAVVTAASTNQSQSASVTPYTELANTIANSSGGITGANIAAANKILFDLIGFDPVATQPLASNVTPGATATDAQKRYALLNAAVSQLAASTPKTDDATTVACFSAAGGDAGKKILCAVKQIATSVTVSGTGAQAVAAPNKNIVGLSDALATVAADTTINKTGVALGSGDSVLKAIVAAAAASVPVASTPAASPPSATTPITATAPPPSDVAVSKTFFASLRANAASLKSGTADTGITDGIKAFGDSVRGEASEVTHNTIDFLELSRTAVTLWRQYTSGGTTNPNIGYPALGVRQADSNFFNSGSGCSVYQGTFPKQFGPAGVSTAIGTPYVSDSVLATSPTNAAWVGCSLNYVNVDSAGKRHRQSILIDMKSDPDLHVVPYLAATRAYYVVNNKTTQELQTPTLSGAATFATDANGDVTAASLRGDLPPEVVSHTAGGLPGQLKAARYSVDVGASIAPLANGTRKLSFSAGKLGIVPVGATDVALTIDLSVNGASYAVIPGDYQDPVQLAARAYNLAAKITDAHGSLTGTLLIDRFVRNDDGGMQPTHATFTGDLAVAPSVGGTLSAVVPVFSGALEVTDGDKPDATFSGTLSLPNRPVATLTASVTEVSSSNYQFEGRYRQNGLMVSITGTRLDSRTAVTFADSTGVSFSYAKSSGTTPASDVTVSGRKAAVIDWNAKTVTYTDGTFESIL